MWMQKCRRHCVHLLHVVSKWCAMRMVKWQCIFIVHFKHFCFLCPFYNVHNIKYSIKCVWPHRECRYTHSKIISWIGAHNQKVWRQLINSLDIIHIYSLSCQHGLVLLSHLNSVSIPWTLQPIRFCVLPGWRCFLKNVRLMVKGVHPHETAAHHPSGPRGATPAPLCAPSRPSGAAQSSRSVGPALAERGESACRSRGRRPAAGFLGGT